MLYVSAYTPDYEDMAKRLRASLDALGLSHNIIPVESQGSRLANLYTKPQWAKQASNGIYPFTWVDADAVIHHPITSIRLTLMPGRAFPGPAAGLLTFHREEEIDFWIEATLQEPAESAPGPDQTALRKLAAAFPHDILPDRLIKYPYGPKRSTPCVEFFSRRQWAKSRSPHRVRTPLGLHDAGRSPDNSPTPDRS